MESIIIVIHVLAAIGITGLVLIQQGKGADMGASFGSGASGTMFGASGSGNVLTKGTTILAVVFFATSLALAMVARQKAELNVIDNGLISNMEQVNVEMEASAADNADVPTVEAGTDDVPGGQATDDVPSLLEESSSED